METGTISATTPSTSASTAAAPSQSLDKNAFLKLLVAQLQHQDPTNTQDPSQMIQQLTGFSTLEQITALGTQIQGLQVQTQGLFQAQVAGLVGKKILVPGDAVALQGGQATIGLKLAANAQQVTITIKDASGNVVRTISQGAMGAGSQKVAWDGKDAQGITLPDGRYTVEASAADASGKPVNIATTSYLKVDAVSFKDGVVFLVAGGRTFSLSDVTEIAA
jgi:flagellar basal-body rod modification protein FlgD